ncbi:glycoprotein endo-alpha-1,2-mannosidase [Daphnia magna]|uniref:glycoprotein endo-alpha-1,2-mannosidase n=1 Tax=Daphnia magna TaxID=35525 RepID=UPI001E1BA0AB|nr:glycoprotein endo-alpha-1,2-mannosidase [Daphnia magna]
MIPKRNCYLLCKNVMIAVFFYAFLFMFIRLYFSQSSGKSANDQHLQQILLERKNVTVLPDIWPKDKVAYRDTTNNISVLSDNVHIFYYPWFGNPEDDSVYLHWNHEYLPNWDEKDKNVYPTGKHVPPGDIGANFYPLLGCYSSKNPVTVGQHMKWIRQAGIGVLVISWYPPDLSDKEGKPFDQLFPMFLETASVYNLKISFHIEPYEGRNPENLRKNIKYIIEKYGNHTSVYKLQKSPSKKPLPVFYIYDSYLNSPNSWSSVLSVSGKQSIRNTDIDGIFLGLVVEFRHKQDIVSGGFDGFYTYFAANGFSYGSSWKNWKSLSSFARKNGLLFAPSVGPGYIDTRVRPWNVKTTRERKNGKYYKIAWTTALQTNPPLISITSFNEWHEGTQIEPAISKSNKGYVYNDYLPGEPDFYLNLTRQFVSQYSEILFKMKT